MNALAVLGLVLVMQPWGQLSGTDRLVIIGLPTSGKTFHAERLTEDAHRALYVSPNERDYQAPGRLALSVPELVRWSRLLDDPHCRVRVQLQGDDAEELSAEVKQLLPLVKRAGRMVLVLDEVGDYRAECERDLNRVFRRYRHYGVATVLVSQVATDIPLTCRRIASRVLCLAQKHPAELDALAEVYGPEFRERVTRWRMYEPPVEWTAAVENT